MEGAGLEVVDITVSALGDYYEVRNNNLDKNIGAIINLGHETTNVSVFSRGKLMNTETIQLGGINVDKDLAYMFNINVKYIPIFIIYDYRFYLLFTLYFYFHGQ